MLAVLTSAFVHASPAFAQDSPAAPTFTISGYRVEGATLLSGDRIDRVLLPFVGGGRTFADVERARAALEAAYVDAGYAAVQIVVPEQTVASGEVVLRVVEARLGTITIEGNRHFDDANIRRSLPALAAGTTPNVELLGGNLRLANENPVKQTTVVLRPGATEAEVDAAVRVVDQNPHRFNISLDNTGTPQTGDYRIGFGYQNANLWNRDHILNLQYVTSPSKADNPDQLALPPNKNVEIFGGSYRIPFYEWGDSLDLVAGYANVNSGVVQNLFNISGSGRIYAVRYNVGLPRFREVEQRLAIGGDVKYFDNSVVPVGSTTELVPDIVVHPLAAVYSAVWRGAANEASGTLGLYRNIPGGANGDAAQFQAVRPGANPDYFLQRYGVNYVQALPAATQFRFNFSGQFTQDELVPGEQYGIGGQDSVRGFFEREFVGDKGYRGTVEFYSPDFGDRMPVGGVRARALAFYDYGRVITLNPQPGALPSETISSYGAGLRFGYGTQVSLRLDYGIVLNGGGAQTRGDGRGYISFIWVF